MSIRFGGATCVSLVSGIRVANFCAPHAYLFTDGTVLPAVESTLAMARVPEEKLEDRPMIKAPGGETLAKEIRWIRSIPDEVARDMKHLLDMKAEDGSKLIDVILVPTGWYPAWLSGGRAPSDRIRSGVKAGLKWRANEFGVE